MKLGFLLVVGLFFNLMMASLFPYDLLDSDTANLLTGGDSNRISQLGNNPYYNENNKNELTGFVNTVTDEESNKDLLNTQSDSSSIVGSVVNFFDGLSDGLEKLKTLAVFLVPFSSIFWLMGGALGFIIGTLFSALTIFAIIRTIMGR